MFRKINVKSIFASKEFFLQISVLYEKLTVKNSNFASFAKLLRELELSHVREKC